MIRTPSPYGDSLFKRENSQTSFSKTFRKFLLLKRRWIQAQERLKTEEF
jgi:hypothetical protein